MYVVIIMVIKHRIYDRILFQIEEVEMRESSAPEETPEETEKNDSPPSANTHK